MSHNSAHVLAINRQINFSSFIRGPDRQVEWRLGQLEYGSGTRGFGFIDSQRVMESLAERDRDS